MLSFERYGSPTDTAEIRLYGYFSRPDTLTEPDRIAYQDKNAERVIAECSALIEDLKDYRQQLAARYGELETMAYSDTLRLKRYPRAGGIVYELTITRTFEDGRTRQEHRETWPGKERRAALKRFDALRKERPGINAELVIEKMPWER